MKNAENKGIWCKKIFYPYIHNKEQVNKGWRSKSVMYASLFCTTKYTDLLPHPLMTIKLYLKTSSNQHFPKGQTQILIPKNSPNQDE